MLLIITLALSLSTSTAFAATNITDQNSGQINQSTVQNSTKTTNYAAGSPGGATEVTPQVNFTSSQINDASTRVKGYVETNNRLPSCVTIGTKQVSMPQFLQLITQNLLNTGSGLQSAVTLKNVNNPSNVTETVKTGNIYSTEYLNLAQSVKTSIGTTGTAPGYINSTLGKIRFENLVYTFSKILNYQATNNKLPNYVSTKPWTGQNWIGTSTPPVSNNTTNPEGPTPTLNFTSQQINSASSNVINFVGINHKLPNYVTIGNSQLSMSQFLQLLVKNLININNGLKVSVTTGNITGPSGCTEDVKSGNLYQSEYLSLAQTIKTALDKGTAPGYINSTLGKIRFENLVYTFSKILNYQAINNRLPSYVAVAPWTVQNSTPPQGSVLRPVYIISDVISNYSIDNARINSLVTALRSLGVSAYNYGTPGKIWTFLADQSIPSNALLVEIAGGADAGSIKEKGGAWYQGLLGNKEDFIVFTDGAKDITGLDWLERAHDDDYDPPSFTGLAHPDQYLLDHGVGYFEPLTSTNISQCAQAIYKAALT